MTCYGLARVDIEHTRHPTDCDTLLWKNVLVAATDCARRHRDGQANDTLEYEQSSRCVNRVLQRVDAVTRGADHLEFIGTLDQLGDQLAHEGAVVDDEYRRKAAKG